MQPFKKVLILVFNQLNNINGYQYRGKVMLLYIRSLITIRNPNLRRDNYFILTFDYTPDVFIITNAFELNGSTIWSRL